MPSSTRLGADHGTLLLKLIIPNDPFAVRDALRKISDALQKIPVSGEFQSTSQIVLAEALNNIVEHAYDTVGSGQIGLVLRHTDQDLQVELRDQGRPMPDQIVPTADRPRQCPAPETLPEGGFGWKIIDDLAQDLNYRRESGDNILKFRLSMVQMA
ncbi:ATP-binding protein [Actibacterium ureilyticum]|uniref:ATP-binding protein n=1 Tax=Actibacterium ureilyticum TaxID=1590614 RepID=UPI001595636E|nr:ATP-binding protein [Actibacterium ureilyticum]